MEGAAKSPSFDPFCPLFFQFQGQRIEGGAGGYHVVNDGNREPVQSGFYTKCMANIPSPLPGSQAGLWGSVAFSPTQPWGRSVSDYTNKCAREFNTLIETAFGKSFF